LKVLGLKHIATSRNQPSLLLGAASNLDSAHVTSGRFNVYHSFNKNIPCGNTKLLIRIMDTPFPYVQLHESTNLLRRLDASDLLILSFLQALSHLLLLLHNHGFQIRTLLVLRLNRLNDRTQVWPVLVGLSLFACWEQLMCK
jgi:hypothetical protein